MKKLLFCVLLSACPKAELPIKTPPDGPTSTPQTVPVLTPSTPTVKATRGACVETCDLSTDEQVGKLYKQLTGKSLEPVPKCVSRSDSLPRAITVGTFFSDKGCRLQGVFVDCCYSAVTEPDALLNLGWAEVDISKRTTLAEQFARSVILAFTPPLSSATKDFGVEVNGKMTPTFAPLTSTPTKEGGVVVEYWKQASPGMVRPVANEYFKLRLIFEPNGTITGPTNIESFQGPLFESKLKP